jgi:hypothetical protein
MKPLKIAFILIVCLCLGLNNAQAQGLTSGLISVWEFDETSGTIANDAAGSNHGTIHGALINQSGIISTAYQFDNDYVSIPNTSGQFATGDELTISIWINVANSSVSSDAAICLDATSTGSYKYLIYIAGGTTSDYVSLYIRTASGVATANYSVADGTLFNGSWHHLTGVYKRSDSTQRLKLYLDGNLSASSLGYNEPIQSTTNPLVFGKWGSSTGGFYGKIDQTAVWDRALTASEVSELYNSGNGLPYSAWGTITPLSGGTISPSSLTINSGESPGTISTVASASGGDGTYSYQWESSTNGSTFSNITGATGISYSAPTLTQSTWYRRKVTDGASAVAYSNVSAITVNSSLSGGTISPSSLTINSGESPGTISTVASASGGDGTYSYQWEISTNGSTFSNITGATGTSYSAPTLTQSTWYRRKVTDGASAVAYSNVSAIAVTTGGGDCLWDNQITYINYPGKVGINVSTYPSGDYSLAVNGKLKAKEIVVELTGWADYVFDRNYNLKTLEEVENFIQKNKHLPEMPSAKEVEANGVSVGEMNMLLLKKVEELTLYIINQQKEIDALKKQMSKTEPVK